MTPMMGCGHAANAVRTLTDGTKIPSCAICAGIHPGASTIVETPDLTGRQARCTYFNHCHHVQASVMTLAFFEHHPKSDFDTYYCGCMGWD